MFLLFLDINKPTCGGIHPYFNFFFLKGLDFQFLITSSKLFFFDIKILPYAISNLSLI